MITNGNYFPSRITEEQRWLEWKASVQIQAWFRAVRVRSYLKNLHRCATMVQKTWRGFLGRAFVRLLIENQVLIMRRNFYNAMATIVSKHSVSKKWLKCFAVEFVILTCLFVFMFFTWYVRATNLYYYYYYYYVYLQFPLNNSCLFNNSFDCLFINILTLVFFFTHTPI